MQQDLSSIVSIQRAESYEPACLERTISATLEPLGGIDAFVRPGMKVLLKPAVPHPAAPHHAVVTHPEFVAAVGRMVRRCGAEVLIGDSSSVGPRQLTAIWDACEYTQVFARDRLEIVNFEGAGASPVALETRVYYVANPALEADLIINLPKLKTHCRTLLAGAVENVFGVIPGFRKETYWRETRTQQSFARIVVDVFATVQPELSIIDGVLALEGNGPVSGTPNRLNLTLASNDAVALDTAAALILGYDPDEVPTIRIARESGLGIGWIEGIAVRGVSILAAKPERFAHPTVPILDAAAEKLLDLTGSRVWMRPDLDPGRCNGCGQCVSACPTKAWVQVSADQRPKLASDRCIACWSCLHNCPEGAISPKASWRARRLRP